MMVYDIIGYFAINIKDLECDERRDHDKLSEIEWYNFECKTTQDKHNNESENVI